LANLKWLQTSSLAANLSTRALNFEGHLPR
jgi:hypothetical protein